MADDIQRVLRKELNHLMGSAQDERVDDHLERAMAQLSEGGQNSLGTRHRQIPKDLSYCHQ